MDPELKELLMKELLIATQNFLIKVNDALAEAEKERGHIAIDDIINEIDNNEP